MEILPLEAVKKIASYLTVQQLLASSAVNRSWRSIFNEDAVWMPRCTKVPGLVEYLEKTPCVVQPAFVSPQKKDSTLTPICYWRLAFMREVHLWNNWRWGNYKEICILKLNRHLVEEGQVLIEFLSEDYIIIFCYDIFRIYDIRKSPIVKVTEGFHFVPLEMLQFHRINSSPEIRFVCTSTVSSCVRVFHFNANTSTVILKYIFYFEGYRKCFNVTDIEDHEYLQSSPVEPFDCVTIAVTCNRFFVGIVKGKLFGKNAYMHIWDMDQEKKIRAELCPMPGSTFYDVSISKMSENIVAVVIGRLHPHKDSVHLLFHCYLYNLENKVFFPYKHNLSGWCNCVSYSPYISISQCPSLRIRHNNTSELISFVPTKLQRFYCGMCIKMICYYFIFLDVIASRFLHHKHTFFKPGAHEELGGYRNFGDKIISIFRVCSNGIKRQIWHYGITGPKRCELDLKLCTINSHLTRAISVGVGNDGLKGFSVHYFW